MVKTGESYALEGSNTNDLRTVSAKGTVEAGVLTLDATLKITAPIAGTWKLAEIAKDESETFVSGPVSMVWEAAEGTMLGFLPVTSIPNIAEVLEVSLWYRSFRVLRSRKTGRLLLLFLKREWI